jgi:hypothetical protein
MEEHRRYKFAAYIRYSYHPNNSDVVYVAAQGAVHGPMQNVAFSSHRWRADMEKSFVLDETPAQAVW